MGNVFVTIPKLIAKRATFKPKNRLTGAHSTFGRDERWMQSFGWKTGRDEVTWET